MRRLRLLTLLFILASPLPSAAQIATPAGVALSPFPVLQTPSSFPTFAESESGVWSVFIGEQPGSALYAQHMRDDGSWASGFTSAAIALTDPGTQVNGLSACSDGLDGAVLTWFGVSPADSTSPFVALRYLHLFGDGTSPAAFRDTGIVVSNIASAAMVASDGEGGAYVVWEELKGASNPDIYAQHYDYWGIPTWTPSGSPTGVPVCAVVGIQHLRALHSDGQGGAYVVWADMRTANSAPLYVAHLGPNGVAGSPWTANGVRVTPATSGIRIVGSATSPAGGLWLAWRDLNQVNQVNGQHVAPNASFRWAPFGAILATVTPLRADFVPGPSGQAFFTWGGSDIRCARLDSTGVRMWSQEPTGRVIVTPPSGSLAVRAAPDGAFGQRIAWSFDNAGQSDVRMLHVDGAAVPWPGQSPVGDVFAGTLVPEEPVGWFTSASGDPALAWLEAGTLRIRRLVTTSLGVDPTFESGGVALAPPYPQPLRDSRFTVRFAAPAGAARLELFDMAGRRVASRELWSTGGAQSVSWGDAVALAPGVYALRLTAGAHTAHRRVVRLQ